MIVTITIPGLHQISADTRQRAVAADVAVSQGPGTLFLSGEFRACVLIAEYVAADNPGSLS